MESLNGVMKRINKKSNKLEKAISLCSGHMDHNHMLIKNLLKNGKKPGIEFKRDIKYVTQDFQAITEIKMPD